MSGSEEERWVELVREGKKPVATIGDSNIDTNGLVVVPFVAFSGTKMFAVSLKKKVKEVISEDDIMGLDVFLDEELKDVRDRLKKDTLKLYDKIKDSPAGEGLIYILGFPRNKRSTKPPVMLLEGWLYGYNPCCISYFTKICILDRKSRSTCIWTYKGILCSKCLEKRSDRKFF